RCSSVLSVLAAGTDPRRLHDALPICRWGRDAVSGQQGTKIRRGDEIGPRYRGQCLQGADIQFFHSKYIRFAHASVLGSTGKRSSWSGNCRQTGTRSEKDKGSLRCPRLEVCFSQLLTVLSSSRIISTSSSSRI